MDSSKSVTKSNASAELNGNTATSGRMTLETVEALKEFIREEEVKSPSASALDKVGGAKVQLPDKNGEKHAKTVKAPKQKSYTFQSQRSLVKDARDTAISLGGTLAAFDEVVGDLKTIEKMKKDGDVLAVDSTGMPKETRWHQIIRNGGKATFKRISGGEAVNKYADRYDGKDVVYVKKSALKAAKEGRPVTLKYIDYMINSEDGWERQYLCAYDDPDINAIVPLAR